MAYYSGGKVAWLALAFAMAAAAVVVTPCAAQNSSAAQDVVDLHNAARADVGVDPVAWNDTVAAFAQSYADQRQGDCALQHSGGGPNGYGENIFWGPAGKNYTAADVVGLWVSEKQWYDHSSNTCSAPQGESCLHYTQVVWRNSTAIGCGAVECDNNAGVFVTCNYNPAGGQRRGREPLLASY